MHIHPLNFSMPSHSYYTGTNIHDIQTNANIRFLAVHASRSNLRNLMSATKELLSVSNEVTDILNLPRKCTFICGFSRVKIIFEMRKNKQSESCAANFKPFKDFPQVSSEKWFMKNLMIENKLRFPAGI